MPASHFCATLPRMESATFPQVDAFIRSWSAEDVYGRFGSAGIGAPELLAQQLRQHERFALIAVNGNGVIALLDYVGENGMTHFGIVVDARFRRMRIGTTLARALLASNASSGPIQAECGTRNAAAVALLRRCNFTPIASDGYDTTWRYESNASRLRRPPQVIALSRP